MNDNLTTSQRNRLITEQRQIRDHLRAARSELDTAAQIIRTIRDAAGQPAPQDAPPGEGVRYHLDRIEAQLNITATEFNLLPIPPSSEHPR